MKVGCKNIVTSGRAHIRYTIKSNSGQATVELAVLFPVIIIIAFIAVNATLFIGNCAKFDRAFNQNVTMLCTSPGYGQSTENLKASVELSLHDDFDNDFLDFSITVSSVSGGFDKYQGELVMHPTLFGLGLKEQVFGIYVPVIRHNQEIVIEKYKPGVIF